MNEKILVGMLNNELHLIYAKLVSEQAGRVVISKAAEVRMVAAEKGYTDLHARAGDLLIRATGGKSDG